MPRSYRHIKEYEKEIIELVEEGLTLRKIGNKFGLSKEQVKGFLKRERIHKRDEKLKAGVTLKKRGRPPKGSENKRKVYGSIPSHGCFLYCPHNLERYSSA